MTVEVELMATSRDTSQQPIATGWSSPCSDKDLAKIATSISDWRAISPFLGLTEAEESEIIESMQSVPARKTAMLRKWKQKHGASATYKELYRVFETDCGRADLVDKIKQLLTESNSSEGQSCSNTSSASSINYIANKNSIHRHLNT